MASGGRIQGITIELNADTTSLTSALSRTNQTISNTQKELKQVERALQFNPGNTELIRQKQELLQQAVSETTTKLDALRQAQDEVNRKFQAGEISAEEYRSFNRELIATENSLNRFSRELSEMGQVADEAGSRISKIADKAKETGEGMKNAGQGMLGVTAGLGALGGGAMTVAAQFDSMNAKIENSLSATGAELENVKESAKAVWRDGFGESMEDVSNSIIQVKQNMKGLSDGELENATKSAMVLAETFDADVNEVTRAGGNMMKAFGIDSEHAFNLMATGAKKGLNFSNEMFDNLSEYTPLFAEMGYSAEDMFNMLINGGDSAIYNLDYMNDLMKEFQIRTKDGSKATTDAMAEMSDSTQKVWKDMLAGKATVAEVADAVVPELKGMEDQVKANELGVALFGTKWEDMEASAVYSLFETKDALGEVDGAMQGMIENQEQTFGQRFQSLLRQAQESLLPLGNILLDMAEKYLPPLVEKLTKVAEWFSNLSEGSQKLIVGIGLIAAAIGPFLVILGTVVSALGSLVGPVMTVISWFSKLRTVWTVVQGALAVLTGALTWPVAAIAALVAAGVLLWKNWDTVKEKAGQLKDWVVTKFGELKDGASKAITALKDWVSKKFTELKDSTSKVVTTLKDGVVKLFNGLKDSVTTAAGAIKDNVVSRFNSLKTAAQGVWDGIKTGVSNAFNATKTFLVNTAEGIRSSIVEKFNLIKSGMTTAVNTAKSTVETVFKNIKTLMTNPVETAQKAIKTAVDKITGFFKGMKLEIPSIKLPKMPKFKITGKFSLDPPSVPKIGISWNAKGGIFKSPTIFNTANAGLQGVGEAGPEAILPLTQKVLGGIGRGIEAAMEGRGQTVVVNPQPIYLDGELIGNVTFDTINAKQMTAAQLAAYSRGATFK